MQIPSQIIICYICKKVVPYNLKVPHHKIPQCAGGGDKDIVYLHSGCHDDMHKVANMLLHGKDSSAQETAAAAYPYSMQKQQRMLELAQLVAKSYRGKKEGLISVKEHKMEVKITLTPEQRIALFTLAKDSKLSIRKFITSLVKKEIFKRYPNLRKG